MKLEIIKTSVINDYNISGIASTVTGAVYRVDGKEEQIDAEDGKVLVLVIDGVQKDLLAGKTYDVNDSYKFVPVKVYKIGGPSAAPWVGAKEEEKATYYFRQALLVNEGKIDDECSVKDAIIGGTYDDRSADGITINAGGGHFNGILIDNGSKYDIKNATFYARGDGADDLSGWGTCIMADNKSELNIDNTYIETQGATRCAIYVDNTSVANVKNTVIYTQETPDTYKEYQDLVKSISGHVYSCVND